MIFFFYKMVVFIIILIFLIKVLFSGYGFDLNLHVYEYFTHFNTIIFSQFMLSNYDYQIDLWIFLIDINPQNNI